MRIVLVILLLWSTFSVSAQVESNAYSLMLKALLSHSVTEIPVAELKDLKEIILLDAREKPEYDVSHLKNAIHVGYDNFNLDSVKQIDKNKAIVVYCSVGYRSEKIAERLAKAGFTKVSNLYGGIFEWTNQGNTIVDSKGNKTDSIHAYSKTWSIWLTKGIKVYDNPK